MLLSRLHSMKKKGKKGWKNIMYTSMLHLYVKYAKVVTKENKIAASVRKVRQIIIE